MRPALKITLLLVLLTGAGLALLWRGGLLRRSGSTADPRDYRANPHWMEQTEFYGLYADHPKIVFLGTSLSARINWAEALGRSDAAGRGVNGDVTAGILARTGYVTAAPPAVCFVEGGINDLDRGIPPAEIAANLAKTAAQLRAGGTLPVLTAIFPVTTAYPDYGAMNARIDTANALLAAAARSQGWDWLDFNAQLAPAGPRLPQFARGDGLHLSAAGYRIWIAAAAKVLRQKGL